MPLNCVLNFPEQIHSLSGALADQARPVQFGLCIWGQANVWNWGARVVRLDTLILHNNSSNFN